MRALHGKPGVCEAKHAKHKKHTRAKFQRQPTRKHCTNPMFVRRSAHNLMTNISVQMSKGTEGKALHKPDVCDAKYAKQYVTSKSEQIEKGPRESTTQTVRLIGEARKGINSS